MSSWPKLAQVVSSTSRARNGYVHKPKKRKKSKEVILTRRNGQIVNRKEYVFS